MVKIVVVVIVVSALVYAIFNANETEVPAIKCNNLIPQMS